VKDGFGESFSGFFISLDRSKFIGIDQQTRLLTKRNAKVTSDRLRKESSVVGV